MRPITPAKLTMRAKQARTAQRAPLSRAQASIISVVLITGIAVSVIGISYTWGVPLLQKSQTKTETDMAENLINAIAKAANDVAQTGGQTSLPLNLRGPLDLAEEQNSIIYSVTTSFTAMATTEWVPLNDDNKFAVEGLGEENFTAVLGRDKAGLIVSRAAPETGGYKTTYRLIFRELDDIETLDGFLTELKVAGTRGAPGAGPYNLVIRKGTPTVEGKSKLGGDLIVTPLEVSIA